MAVSVPVHSISDYKVLAAKSAMAAMTANAGTILPSESAHPALPFQFRQCEMADDIYAAIMIG
eukprot:scaffold340407_cov41-Prasinocladus_malaysianus.AAC.1